MATAKKFDIRNASQLSELASQLPSFFENLDFEDAEELQDRLQRFVDDLESSDNELQRENEELYGENEALKKEIRSLEKEKERLEKELEDEKRKNDDGALFEKFALETGFWEMRPDGQIVEGNCGFKTQEQIKADFASWKKRNEAN